MEAKVIWTLRARDDLYEIFNKIFITSEDRATMVTEVIIDKVMVLETFPKIGRVVPELEIESIRELLVQDYRVVYSILDSGNVEILAIKHSSRRLSLK